MSVAPFEGRPPRPSAVNVAIAPCRYGAVLVAATDQGICDIHLGANRDELVEGYCRSTTCEVHWVADDEQPGWLTTVLNLVDDPTNLLEYPLDLQGTPFEKRVWQALCTVPVGQTTTYGELAQAIGKPRASRAVGAACGANRLALAIPCHRAIRKGSGPLDYRWGKEIKQKILAAEAAWVFDPQ